MLELELPYPENTAFFIIFFLVQVAMKLYTILWNTFCLHYDLFCLTLYNTVQF